MDKLGKIILSITFILFLTCRKKELIIPNPPVYSPVDDEPTWSPDGKLIAYTHFPYLDTAFANYEIWILNIETGEKRFLCYGFQPDFSPNGKKIAFVDVINYGIAIINVNGDSLVHLTYGRGLSPHWSPDGKRILFWSGQKIWTIKIDGTDEKVLISNAKMIGEADWSPVNPNQLVCSGLWYWGYDTSRAESLFTEAIFICDTLGNNRFLLFKSPLSASYARNPEWSPDGKKVVFSGRLKNQDGWNGPQIYVINADGTNLKQLTTEGGDQPYWSWDAKKIVYLRFNWWINPEEDTRNGYLWVMDADGSNKKQITFP
jgi:Tol biopolymer transport system component